MPSLLERLQEALAPDYTVERTIASGGMGTVFLGRDERLNRRVAIKTLREEIATAVAVERFIQEAQHLASLNHPNIVRVHDAGDADGLVYYVMDYVEGETLEDRLGRGSLSGTETLRLGRELLSALELIHRNRIVHRDIKPGNVFLSGGRAMLADFGIAHTIDKSTALTRPGQLLGTIAYMAPEQLRGEAITSRTDLYALGLVLYEACTGRDWLPLTAPEQGDWAGVPAPLRRALGRALQLDPEKRWDSAVAFARALTGVHPRARAALTLALVPLGLVCGWGIWQALSPATKSAGDIAIFPFEAVGLADTTLGDHIARLTARYLEASPGVLVVPIRTTFQDWRASSLPPAMRVATLSGERGAKFGVWGVVRPSRGGFEVKLYCLEASGSTRLETIVYGNEADRMGVADTIRMRVIGAVLPHAKQLSRNLGGLAGVDPRALPDFLSGEAAAERDAWLTAERHYQNALAIDSTFVLAMWRLANARRWMPLRSNPALPPGFLALYRSRGNNLPAKDRLLIEAQFAPTGDGRLGLYEDALRQAPRDAYVALFYGDELFHRGPLSGRSQDSAIAVLRRVVELDSSLAPALEHLTWGLIRSGRGPEARQTLDALHRAAGKPEESEIYLPLLLELAYRARFGSDTAPLNHPVLDSPFGLSLAARGAFSMDIPKTGLLLGSRLASLPRVHDSLRGSGKIAQGLALMTMGRPTEALRQLDSAGALLSDHTEAKHQSAEWRVIPPALGLPGISRAEAEQGRRYLVQVSRDSIRSVRAAWALAIEALARGDSAGAGPWLELVVSQTPETNPFHALLRAVQLAMAGRPEAALQLSEPALAYDSAGKAGDPFFRAVLHMQRGDWFEQMDRSEAAESSWRWYESLDVIGWPSNVAQAGEVDWPLGNLGRLRRARLAAKSGNKEETCRLTAELTQRWAGAEPPFEPLLAEVRELQRPCG
jgi:tRNA A-37 threonylcarbamoyl transferase component Bud32/tetratricopeptide (TPR) repeat protein